MAGSAGGGGEKFDKRKFEEKFHPPEELERSRNKRAKELEVLLGEVDSLSKGARIYEGTSGVPGAVFLLSRDRTAVKSAVKKEIRELKRAKAASSENSGREGTALNF